MSQPSFEQRWSIDVSPDQAFGTLKNRLKLILTDVDASEKELGNLAFRLGRSLREVQGINSYSFDSFVEAHYLIDKASSQAGLAPVLEALLEIIEDFSSFGDAVAKLVNSSNCGIMMKKVANTWLTYPAGEKKLDEELVNKPLNFLEGGSLDEYIKALEHYGQGKWEESAEKTRRALEEYLRLRTSTTKGLDQLILLVAQKLKAKGEIPDHLRNAINEVLRSLDKNYNESSKHNSKTFGDIEAEFLIYQTGLLMRLLSRIDL